MSLRMRSRCPLSNDLYREWLTTTPWRPDLKNPLGPWDVIWPDTLVFCTLFLLWLTFPLSRIVFWRYPIESLGVWILVWGVVLLRIAWWRCCEAQRTMKRFGPRGVFRRHWRSAVLSVRDRDSCLVRGGVGGGVRHVVACSPASAANACGEDRETGAPGDRVAIGDDLPGFGDSSREEFGEADRQVVGDGGRVCGCRTAWLSMGPRIYAGGRRCDQCGLVSGGDRLLGLAVHGGSGGIVEASRVYLWACGGNAASGLEIRQSYTARVAGSVRRGVGAALLAFCLEASAMVIHAGRYCRDGPVHASAADQHPQVVDYRGLLVARE